MDLSDQSFSRLLDLTYDTLEKPNSWRTLYEQICKATGATSVHIFCVDNQHRTLSYSDGANLPVQGELAYMRHYHFIDPRIPLMMAKPMHEWIHCHEELDEVFVANDPFYQEFLLPYGRRYVSACKLVDNCDATIGFGIFSSPGQGPLSSEAVAFLDRCRYSPAQTPAPVTRRCIPSSPCWHRRT